MRKYDIYDRVMKLNRTPEQRAFLNYVDVGWYIESQPDKDGLVQSGTVTGVIRDRYHVPVCLKIESGSGEKDVVSVDSILFYEPDKMFITDFWEYNEANTVESANEYLAANGYVYDEDEGCWRNTETGEEVGY